MTRIPELPEPIGPTTAERPGADAGQPPTGGRVVGIILGVVIASASIMATFIWYRWQSVTEPTTAIIVEGDAALAGAVITVTGGPRPITTELTDSNNYVAPVMLEPGLYTVTVMHESRLLRSQRVEVERFVFLRLKLGDAARPRPGNPATPPTRPTDP